MKLSPPTQKQLVRAATAFAQEVAAIVAKDARADIIAQVRAVVDKLDGEASTPRRVARRRSTRKGHRTDYEKITPRFIALLRAAGGTVAPPVVSKAFRLTPEQRRRLVRKAIKQGLVKVTGERRTTCYVLVAKAKAKTKAKKSRARRKRRKKASKRRRPTRG